MKYKRHLMGSILAFTIMVGGSSVFAADVNIESSTKLHQIKNQVHMKSSKSNGKVDAKDGKGNDIETQDDVIKKRNTTLKQSTTHVKRIKAPKTKVNKSVSEVSNI
jgi:hypothetical protein